MKDLNSHRNEAGVLTVIKSIVDGYATSTLPNHKKGGMIALAAIAIGLGTQVCLSYKLGCPKIYQRACATRFIGLV